MGNLHKPATFKEIKKARYILASRSGKQIGVNGPNSSTRIYCSPDGFGGIQAAAGFSGTGRTATLLSLRIAIEWDIAARRLPLVKVPVVLSPRLPK